MMQEHDPVDIFREEVRELLADLEETLLELEGDPCDADKVARAFRDLHTIKGSGAMFGFAEIARFTHDLETAFDRVRSNTLPLSAELLGIALEAKDHIQALLGTSQDGAGLTEASDALLARLARLLESPGKDACPPGADLAAEPAGEHGAHREATFWVRYRPTPDSFVTGCDPLGLIEELCGLGESVVVFHPGEPAPLAEHDPERPHGWWDVLLATGQGENAVRDVFLFVDDGGAVRVEHVGDGRPRRDDLDRLAAVAGECRDAACEDGLPELLRRSLREKLERRRAPKAAEAASAGRGDSSIRVDASRLDHLVNMVGEMVIIQSRLSQAVDKALDRAVLAQIAEDLQRLTDAMRDNALGLRMLPIGTVYGNLRRLVRDVSASLGKNVEFVAEGGDTELDKTVIDRLKDPLVHILRNSLDHGIESPAERAAAGKAEQGTVRLWAGHVSGEVVIRVSDDGKGLDQEKIRRKAQAMGLIAPEAELERKELLNLIFEPGFSTAEKVSDLSGRGVGMDVVKRSIEALRGKMEIDSEPGKGVVLTVRLPLTLAIIDGFCVLIGSGSYIVPLTALRGFQERPCGQDHPVVGVIERMGRLLPCVNLRALFGVAEERPDYERIVVAEVGGTEIGLAVDKVVGRQQAVIKSLDEMYRNVAFISGTTINGDGSISLILDVQRLVEFAAARAEGAA
ncbi:CheA signal transduction histidine kinase [Desulfovibrio sp. X2]|uniref:chemotaxis protein CheA n=1 Tax=Desulfovibrio sp. X2 TaxID=941449 RepID=UPI000358DCD2|nr:chemotaxis protein CheA [Desulfovibrio sp. X2]EPR43967.1 CheA signal transduction histidine kinase [Desulfovibrio sp. X2]